MTLSRIHPHTHDTHDTHDSHDTHTDHVTLSVDGETAANDNGSDA